MSDELPPSRFSSVFGLTVFSILSVVFLPFDGVGKMFYCRFLYS